MPIIKFLRRLKHRFFTPGEKLPPDFDPQTLAIIQTVRPYIMTAPKSLSEMCSAVRYLVKNNIAGDFAECGVGKGGSAMAMLCTLRDLDVSDRNIYMIYIKA